MKRLLPVAALALLASCSISSYKSKQEAEQASANYKSEGVSITYMGYKPHEYETHRLPESVIETQRSAQTNAVEACKKAIKRMDLPTIVIDGNEQTEDHCAEYKKPITTTYLLPKRVETKVSLRRCHHTSVAINAYVCADAEPPKEGIDHVYKELPKLKYNKSKHYFRY